MIRLFNKYIKPISFAVVFVLTITLANVNYTYAAVYEDCDQDGYDDYTGKALPWIFFDGTKGDEIPSDWDWNPAHTASSESAYYASRKSNDDSAGSKDSDSKSDSNQASGSQSKSSSGSSTKSSSTKSGSSKSSSSRSSTSKSSSSEKSSVVKNSSSKSKTTTANSSKEENITNKNSDEKIETTENKKETKKKTGDDKKSKNKKNKVAAEYEEETVEAYVQKYAEVAQEGTSLASEKKGVSSFTEALFVGFSGDNKQLVPGIVLLLLLTGSGVFATTASTIKEKLTKNKN